MKLALLVVVKMLVEMLLEMWVKMEGATRSRPSSGRRRLEGPASPLWSLAAYQIQELEIVGGGGRSPSGTLLAASSAKEAWWAAARWLRRGFAPWATVAAALTRDWGRGVSRGR